ncbi:MAG: DinB family protein [Actinobacteria bacterium]|nr:DinB family protein [Actinomycetota bacterium]
MTPRPLRQFYDHDRRFVLDGLDRPEAAFRRHRARFLGALASLTDAEWAATTRCDAWSAKDVVLHLVSADGYWALTLPGRSQAEKTTYLRGFDPTSTPDAVIASKREQTTTEALAALAQSTDQLAAAFAQIGDDEWSLLSESPFGHVPVRVIAAHALWDSWLHERDVLVPLGRSVPVEIDELLNATAFTLFLGGAQGGVLDDAGAVGDGPDATVVATVAFDDLPVGALHIRVDRDVTVRVDRDVTVGVTAAARADGAVRPGSAVDFVEAVAGRAPTGPVLARLPADLSAQLARASQVL